MQDGAPPHFSNDVRAFLFRQYPALWIGRGPDAPIEGQSDASQISREQFKGDHRHIEVDQHQSLDLF